ncbi:MAG: hypothetical protein M1835_004376 [Candelina submexicana]|nr:MAG: hypothetical protein M1835_004376 [Candelina submexicana]
MSGKSPGPQPAPRTGIQATIWSKFAGLLGTSKVRERSEDLSTEVVEQVTDELDCPPPKRQRTIERITPKQGGTSSPSTPQPVVDLGSARKTSDKSPDEWPARPLYASGDNLTAPPRSGSHRKRVGMPSQVICGFQPRNTLNHDPYSKGLTNITQHSGIFKYRSKKRSHRELDMESVSGLNVPNKAFDSEGASAEHRQFKKPRISSNAGPHDLIQRADDDDGDVKILGGNVRASSNFFNSPRKPSDTPSSISFGSGKGPRKSRPFGEIREYRALEDMIAPRKGRSPLNRSQSNGHQSSQIDGSGDSQDMEVCHAPSTSNNKKHQVTIDLSIESNSQDEAKIPWKGTAFLRAPREKEGPTKPDTKLTSMLRDIDSSTSSRHFPVNNLQQKLARSTSKQLQALQSRGTQPLPANNLRDNFRRTSESSDELQNDNAASHQIRRVQNHQMSHVEVLPSSPSNIESSHFYSSGKSKEMSAKSKNAPRARNAKLDHQELRLKQFRTGDSALPQGYDYSLFFDSKSSQYHINRAGQSYTAKYKYLKIEPQKLFKIIYGLEESCKIHLMESNKNERIDSRFDVELFSNKDVVDLANALQTLAGPSCKAIGKPSNGMDKLFDKRAEERLARKSQNFINPCTKTPISQSELAEVTVQKAKRPTQTSDQRPSKISDFVKSSPDPPEFISNSLPQVDRVAHTEPVGGVPGRRARTRSSTGKDKIRQTLSPEPEEVPEENRYSKRVGLGKPWTKWALLSLVPAHLLISFRPLIYPAQGPKRATVEFHDLERLDDGQFLNDNLVSFYLRFLEYQNERRNPDVARRMYFFNTYFYASLSKAPRGKRINYELVQRWTSKVDLFTYDFVVVPINENAHWGDPSSPFTISMFDGASDVPEPLMNTSSPAQDDHEAMSESDAEVDEAEEQVSRMCLSQGNIDNTNKPNVAEDQAASECASVGDADADELCKKKPDHDENPQCNASTANPKSIRPTSVDPFSSPAEDTLINVEHQQQQDVQATKLKKTKAQDPSLERPKIITLDSLGLPHPATARNLKEYIVLEGKSKRNFDVQVKDIPAKTVKNIPLQENYCDCGLFLLGYVAKFLQEPREFVGKVLNNGYDVSNDWPELDASEMRANIRSMIMNLHEQQEGGKKGTPTAKSIAQLKALDNLNAAEKSKPIDTGHEVFRTPQPPKEVTEPGEQRLKKGSPELSGGISRADVLEGASRIDEPVVPSADLAVPVRPSDGYPSMLESTESKATSRGSIDDTPIVTKERPVQEKKHRPVKPEMSDAFTLNVEDDLAAEIPSSPQHSPLEERQRVRKSPERSPAINEYSMKHSPYFDIPETGESEETAIVENLRRPRARDKLI